MGPGEEWDICTQIVSSGTRRFQKLQWHEFLMPRINR